MATSGLSHLRLVTRGTRLRRGVKLELELRHRSAYRLSELVSRKSTFDGVMHTVTRQGNEFWHATDLHQENEESPDMNRGSL